MTRKQVILKAIEGRITWIQAATIIGISDRQMRRLKQRYLEQGYGGLRDYRAGKPRRKRIAVATIERLLELKRTKYPDFSIKHFHERITEVHGLEISYTWTRVVLQEAGLAEKAPARGKYRRRRERRPMTGILVHLDASTHDWIPGLDMWDLNVALDDADGRILFAEFVEEEGLMSTLRALDYVLRHHGRFCELYTDRGSHFCHTPVKGRPAAEQHGNVPRALRTLGIRQILGRSPQARGRSERCFGTIQGRLPQELRLNGICDYQEANRYLQETFVPDFNRRFSVRPAQRETAFVPIAGLDLDPVISAHHERTVRNDSTVPLNGVILQLPKLRDRPSLARCPVTVHQFIDGTLGVSYQGSLLERYAADGSVIRPRKRTRRAA